MWTPLNGHALYSINKLLWRHHTNTNIKKSTSFRYKQIWSKDILSHQCQSLVLITHSIHRFLQKQIGWHAALWRVSGHAVFQTRVNHSTSKRLGSSIVFSTPWVPQELSIQKSTNIFNLGVHWLHFQKGYDRQFLQTVQIKHNMIPMDVLHDAIWYHLWRVHAIYCILETIFLWFANNLEDGGNVKLIHAHF